MEQHVRADRDVLGICASVREAEDLVADLEMLFDCWTEGGDSAAELDAEDGSGLGWERVVAIALEQVHAVKPEGFDFYDGLAGASGGLGGVGIDEEGVGGAVSSFDVCCGVSLRFGYSGKWEVGSGG